MNLKSILVMTAAVLTFGAASFAGDIVGTVTLKGTPPAEIPIPDIKSDPVCSKFHPDGMTTHHYVVGPNQELANVVVMLKGISGKSTGASAKSVELDQKGCEYVPQILAIQTGQKLLVKNSDPVAHNIHLSPASPGGNAGKNNENQLQPEGGPDLTLSFPAPENFIKFQCDVHKWMFAWVTVVDHPYFAVTGKDGTFKISNVPAGKYTITAMHRKAAPNGMDKEIEVKDGEPVKVDFTLEVPAALK